MNGVCILLVDLGLFAKKSTVYATEVIDTQASLSYILNSFPT